MQREATRTAALLALAVSGWLTAGRPALAEEAAEAPPAEDAEAAEAAAPASTAEAFVALAREADVALLGGVPGNPDHARTQAEVVAALSPAAIVFEAIPQAREAELNELRDAGGDAASLVSASGLAPEAFAPLAAIMAAAPQAHVLGAAQPEDDLREAREEGAAAAFGADSAIYGIDAPLTDAQAAALAPCDPAQGPAGQPGQGAEAEADRAAERRGDIEVMRFREAGLADAAIWARIMAGDAQIVVIAGDAAVDKANGAAAMIARAEPEARIATLAQFEGAAGAGEFDAVLVTPAPAGRPSGSCDR